MQILHRLDRRSTVLLVADTHLLGIKDGPADVVWFGNPQIALHHYLTEVLSRGLSEPEVMISLGLALEGWRTLQNKRTF